MKEKKEKKEKKSITLDKEVVEGIAKKAEKQKRSFSFVVNEALKNLLKSNT